MTHLRCSCWIDSRSIMCWTRNLCYSNTSKARRRTIKEKIESNTKKKKKGKQRICNENSKTIKDLSVLKSSVNKSHTISLSCNLCDGAFFSRCFGSNFLLKLDLTLQMSLFFCTKRLHDNSLFFLSKKGYKKKRKTKTKLIVYCFCCKKKKTTTTKNKKVRTAARKRRTTNSNSQVWLVCLKLQQVVDVELVKKQRRSCV